MRKNKQLTQANAEFEYTPEMIIELEKCAADPIYFIETYVRIQHPTKGAIPFEMYDFQKEIVEVANDEQLVIVTIGRQSGKTTVSSAYALWFACFHDDVTVLVASNKNSNAMEIIHRAKYAYENLPNWLKPGVDPSMWTKHDLGFDNKSRILSQATTESTGRGLSISLCLCDELAFVDPKIADAFWMSISPTLATGGKMLITSTPNGDSNLFAQQWRAAEAGTNGFVPLFYDWTAVPGRTQDFLDREIAKLGQLRVDQEYHCKFISSDATLFDQIAIERLSKTIDPRFPPSKDMLVAYEQIGAGETYIITLDPSAGKGKDYSAIEVFKVGAKLKQVAEFRSNTTSSSKLYKQFKDVLKMFEKNMQNTVYFTVESNGVGEGVLALYENDTNIADIGACQLVSSGSSPGMYTSGPSKMKACLQLKEMVETDKIELHSKTLINEMKVYVKKGASYEAQYGGTDDLISACLLMTRVLDDISSYNTHAMNALYSYDAEGISEEDQIFIPSFM